MTFRSLTRALLEHISENGYLLIDGLFPPQYPEAQISRAILGLDNFDRFYPSRKAAKRSLSSILSRLKKQGLVSWRGSQRDAQWKLTAAGRKFLKETQPALNFLSDLPPTDGIVRIITFDVPEKKREKRNWLRATLISCGYEPIQKSVYLGTRPLPEDAIREIDERGLGTYVHIAGINQSGTLAKNTRRH